MKSQNCILINFEWMHGRMDRQTDGQAQSNLPLQLFQSRGHNKMKRKKQRLLLSYLFDLTIN